MTVLYILNEEKEVIPCDDPLVWGEFFEKIKNRRVAWEEVEGLVVSTVFLGIDHQYEKGPPLLFETMVFRDGSRSECHVERCSTWEEAVKMHQNVVAKVEAGEIE